MDADIFDLLLAVVMMQLLASPPSHLSSPRQLVLVFEWFFHHRPCIAMNAFCGSVC